MLRAMLNVAGFPPPAPLGARRRRHAASGGKPVSTPMARSNGRASAYARSGGGVQDLNRHDQNLRHAPIDPGEFRHGVRGRWRREAAILRAAGDRAGPTTKET
jgi:hypothetical protein